MHTFRLGMAQTLVEGGRPGPNLDRAVAAIHRAAELGCRVVVLPECLDLGWTDPSARELAQPIPGPHFDRLATAAREASHACLSRCAREGSKAFGEVAFCGVWF